MRASSNACLLFLGALLTSHSCGSHACGEIIELAKYGFDSGTYGATSLAPGVSAGAVSVTGYTLGAGDTTGVYYANSSEFRVYFQNTVVGTNNTEALAAELPYYFDIVLSPDGDGPLRLSTLTLSATGTNTTNSRTFFARYDYTGDDPQNAFAGPSLLTGLITTTAWQPFGTSENLSDLPDIMPGEQLTLRFYQYRDITTNYSGAQNIRYDNILITGTILPEPTSAVLVLLALAGLAAFRPRRRP
ncbi:MAG: hypothetical protein U1E05_20110 [Patescibacteria group bacterium]|nr:hypothetical protein [Patescibacteria group bacterium]